MSPIEYIKEGIREGNWETVCEGYERLTGEALQLPGTTTASNDAECALRQIADIVLGLPKIKSTTTSVEKPPKLEKKKSGKPKGSKNSKTKKKSIVTTDGEDTSILLNDSDRTTVQRQEGGVRLITNDPDPKEVERNKKRALKARSNKLKLDRPVARKYEAICNECEGTFEADRPSGEMGQKCPKCLGGQKSRFNHGK